MLAHMYVVMREMCALFHTSFSAAVYCVFMYIPCFRATTIWRSRNLNLLSICRFGEFTCAKNVCQSAREPAHRFLMVFNVNRAVQRTSKYYTNQTNEDKKNLALPHNQSALFFSRLPSWIQSFIVIDAIIIYQIY